MKRICTALLAMVLCCPALQAQQVYSKPQKEQNMTTQQNKETVRMVYEQALNKRQPQLLPGLISDAYTGPGGTKGAQGFAIPTSQVIKAFPDAQWHIENMVAEGDQVMIHWRLTGTHQGAFNNYEPTGHKITGEGMAVYTLHNGKITAVKLLTDRLGFLQQLDALPPDTALQQTGKNNVYFIDKFLVPPAAIIAFHERMNYNRAFIRDLPGFITDAAYEHTDPAGNLVCITVAQWASADAMNKAKEAVQAAYKQQGFDPAAMMQNLQIQMDRGLYSAYEEK